MEFSTWPQRYSKVTIFNGKAMAQKKQSVVDVISVSGRIEISREAQLWASEGHYSVFLYGSMLELYENETKIEEVSISEEAHSVLFVNERIVLVCKNGTLLLSRLVTEQPTKFWSSRVCVGSLINFSSSCSRGLLVVGGDDGFVSIFQLAGESMAVLDRLALEHVSAAEMAGNVIAIGNRHGVLCLMKLGNRSEFWIKGERGWLKCAHNETRPQSTKCSKSGGVFRILYDGISNRLVVGYMNGHVDVWELWDFGKKPRLVAYIEDRGAMNSGKRRWPKWVDRMLFSKRIYGLSSDSNLVLKDTLLFGVSAKTMWIFDIYLLKLVRTIDLEGLLHDASPVFLAWIDLFEESILVDQHGLISVIKPSS